MKLVIKIYFAILIGSFLWVLFLSFIGKTEEDPIFDRSADFLIASILVGFFGAIVLCLGFLGRLLLQ